jgi:hypothetical protein
MALKPANSAVRIMTLKLGGGASGSPERFSQTCTEAPIGVLLMAGAVTEVRMPDRSVPLGSRHLATAEVETVVTGPGWDSIATVGRMRAAAVRSDW